MQKQHVNDAAAQLQQQTHMILSQGCFCCVTELWNYTENNDFQFPLVNSEMTIGSWLLGITNTIVVKLNLHPNGN